MATVINVDKNGCHRPPVHEDKVPLETLATLRRLDEIYRLGKFLTPSLDRLDELAKKQKELDELRTGQRGPERKG